MDQQQQSVTPSPPSSPPPSPSTGASSIAHLTGLIVVLAIVIPIALYLPNCFRLAFSDCKQWQPLAAAFFALGMAAAPAPTLELAKELAYRVLDRFLPAKGK